MARLVSRSGPSRNSTRSAAWNSCSLTSGIATPRGDTDLRSSFLPQGLTEWAFAHTLWAQAHTNPNRTGGAVENQGTTAIAVEDLTKVYPGGKTARAGVSFAVDRGEI